MAKVIRLVDSRIDIPAPINGAPHNKRNPRSRCAPPSSSNEQEQLF